MLSDIVGPIFFILAVGTILAIVVGACHFDVTARAKR